MGTYTHITGTGYCLGERAIRERDLMNSEFYGPDKKLLEKTNPEIIAKLIKISGIHERRFISHDKTNSDLAKEALEEALGDKKPDHIFVTHNSGEVPYGEKSPDLIAPHSSRLKDKLGIKDPKIRAADFIFETDEEQRQIFEELHYGKNDLIAMFDESMQSIESKLRKIDKLENILYVHRNIPSVAGITKRKTGNEDVPSCDFISGCTGTIRACGLADHLIREGYSKRLSVGGSETLSRAIDMREENGKIILHGINEQLFADGAGFFTLEPIESDTPVGFVAHSGRTYADLHHLLRMEESYKPGFKPGYKFLKMDGNELFEAIMANMPEAMHECIRKAGFTKEDIYNVPMHQANEKLELSLFMRYYYGDKYSKKEAIQKAREQLPIMIYYTGNISTASSPVLFALMARKHPFVQGHEIKKGRHYLFSTMGAGTNFDIAYYIATGHEIYRLAA